MYRLGWVEFYRYQTFKVGFVKIYVLDKKWTFNIVCIKRDDQDESDLQILF